MKLKVYILKKKHILIAASILFFLIISLIVLIAFKSKETIRNVNPVQIVYSDIDGDKNLDHIYISTENDNTYSVNIKTNKGMGFTLKPDPLFESIGKANTIPISVECKDIDNNSTQEVIIQGFDEIGPILHIYSYSKKNNSISKVISGRYYSFETFVKDKTSIIALGQKDDLSNSSFKYFSYLDGETSLIKPDISLESSINSIDSFFENNELETSSFEKSQNIRRGEVLDYYLINSKYIKGNPYEHTYKVRMLDKISNEKITYEIKTKPKGESEDSIIDIKKVN